MANEKYLDKNGLIYFWSKLKAILNGKVDTEVGKGLSSNDYTTAEKTKLAGVETGANNYSLPTAAAATLGGIKVGQNLTIDQDGVLSAVQGAYTLPIASASTLGGIKVGTNLTIDSSTGVLTATDTTYSNATTSTAGLMSAADKTKLDGINITGIYNYIGSVATYNDLPASGNTPGDVYDVQTDGMNYAWTSTGSWDALGGSFSISAITNAEIDAIMAA